VTITDNIWCYFMLKNCDFLGQYCPNMGHLKTFCQNIMVSKMGIISCYYMLTKCDVWDNNVKIWDNKHAYKM
jgi:hypothetical protein